MARHSSTLQRRPKTQTAESADDPMTACAKVCHETVTYCLEQGGEHAEAPHIKVMMDCADICTWTATLEHRRSDFLDQAMRLCAEACKACAESCETFEDDETMQACAEACRECQEHCEG